MSKLVCHVGKFSRGNVFGLQKHNQRENKNYSNENIDLEQSKLNYDLANQNNINYLKKVDEVISKNRTNSNRAVRKDAVVYCETVVGSDKQFFEKLNHDEKERFFKESYNYLAEKIGKENIVAANIHMDEGNPHMHFNFVPVIDGALSAKKLINRNFLREVQEEFPKYLKSKGFDIERGMENSLKKHLEPLEFKKKEIKKDIENAKQEQERFKEKYANFKEIIKTRAETLQNTSENLSKLEEHTKGVLGKLDKIEAKKGLFSDKLTISEQDYSVLVNLAKSGEGKTLENLQLKSKIGDLEQKLNKKGLDEHQRDIKLQSLNDVEGKYLDLQKKYRNLNHSFERVETVLDKLDLTDKVNNELKSMKMIEKSKSFDMGR